MIIGCHGHYITTAARQAFRDAELAHLADPGRRGVAGRHH